MSSRGHAEDVARQREEVSAFANQILAQLVPGSQEYTDFQAFAQEMIRRTEEGPFAVSQLGGAVVDQQEAVQRYGQQLVSQQGQRIASGEAATPLEARTQAAFGGLREAAKPSTVEQDLKNALAGLGTTTPSGTVFSRTVNRAASPQIDDEVFRNALKLVEDRVNTEYAGRGLLGGGLRLEGLGRAGVEASIAEAERQDKLRQEAYQNFTGLYDQGEVLKNRDIGLEEALVNMQLGRESKLTDLLSANSNLRLNDLNQLLTRTTTQATADRLDAEDAAAARKAGLGTAIGTGLGAVVGSIVPGVGTAIGAGIGGKIGGGLSGGGTSTAPANAGQFLAAQQAQTTSTGAPATPPLTRQSSSGSLDLEQLIQILKQSGALN